MPTVSIFRCESDGVRHLSYEKTVLFGFTHVSTHTILRFQGDVNLVLGYETLLL